MIIKAFLRIYMGLLSNSWCTCKMLYFLATQMMHIKNQVWYRHYNNIISRRKIRTRFGHTRLQQFRSKEKKKLDIEKHQRKTAEQIKISWGCGSKQSFLCTILLVGIPDTNEEPQLLWWQPAHFCLVTLQLRSIKRAPFLRELSLCDWRILFF